MKYKERIATTIVITLLVLFTLIIYERHDKRYPSWLLDDKNQCVPRASHMTADWTVDSIYDDLNFTLNKDDGLYTVLEKTNLNRNDIKHSEPLKIIVVPHSHNDPGWLWTFEDYYTIRTQNILTNTVSSLKRFPEFRMIWTETVFLERWWQDSSELLRSEFRDLVRKGKIEILSGGWVSVDEATTHYTAVLDQLIEGHLWIKEHFGVNPNTSWSIDPFGYSSSLPYLWKKSGMKNMAILRIHGAVKGYMGNRKMLTYKWRQPWDAKGQHDILCHVEPYTLYNIECSCGPDTEVCNVLDFSSKGDFSKEIIYFGKNRQAKNFEEFAELVVGQYKKKAALYNHNVILMPHGDDFRYIEEYDFEVNYNNMKKLMDYVNSKKDLNVEMKFGTVGDYFEILRSEMGKHKSNHVSLTGDFFTYTDKENDYWSGYFSTRPFDKRMIRELLEYLRTTETMVSLIYVYLVQNTHIQASEWRTDWKTIAHARRTHGLVQHHDAITGTSTAATVMDFEIRIHEAINGLLNVLQNRISSLLMPGTNTNVPDLKLTRQLSSPTTPFEDIMLRITDKVSVVFINSYSKQRREVVRLSVNTNDIEVFDSKSNIISFQISPLWSYPYIPVISTHGFEINFEIDVPAIGLSVYTIKRKFRAKTDKIKSNKQLPGVVANIFHLQGKINNANKEIFTLKSNAEQHSPDNGIFSIENQYIKLSCLTKNGALQSICVKSSVPHCVQVKIQFFRYFGNNSNAYCFNSDGEEEELQSDIQSVTLVRGASFSQVRVRHRIFTHVVTLYNTSSLQGQSVHIDNIVNLQIPDDKNTEFMMRFNTDIRNLGTRYFTDSNGFQMVSRKLRKNLPIGANFYPITSMAVIEDTETRFTLHTAQPHGIGSFSTGSVEVMLDRIPMSSGKGLEEAVTDNKPAASKFIIQIERVDGRHVNSDYRKYQIYPSLTSHTINDFLQSPIVPLYSSVSKFYFNEFTFLEDSMLPCDITIANLRSILTENANFESTGLTLHKRITSCNVKGSQNSCSESNYFNLESIFKHLELLDVRHMSLSHLYEISSPSKHANIIEPMELESYQYRWKL